MIRRSFGGDAWWFLIFRGPLRGSLPPPKKGIQVLARGEKKKKKIKMKIKISPRSNSVDSNNEPYYRVSSETRLTGSTVKDVDDGCDGKGD